MDSHPSWLLQSLESGFDEDEPVRTTKKPKISSDSPIHMPPGTPSLSRSSSADSKNESIPSSPQPPKTAPVHKPTKKHATKTPRTIPRMEVSFTAWNHVEYYDPAQATFNDIPCMDFTKVRACQPQDNDIQ